MEQTADRARTEFREAIDRAEPNPGHHTLAELENMGLLNMTITQNVDNLHFKAGSIRMAEIHGNPTKLRCIECELHWPRDEFTIDRLPPACPACRGLGKDDTVMFIEPISPDILDMCFTEVAPCDYIVVAEISAMVYPSASPPPVWSASAMGPSSRPTPMSLPNRPGQCHSARPHRRDFASNRRERQRTEELARRR